MFPFLMEILTVFILLDFIPPSQERWHCLKYVGIRISFIEFDVKDGASLSVPKSPDDYVTICLQTVTTLTYPPLWSDMALGDEVFGTYKIWGEGSSNEV